MTFARHHTNVHVTHENFFVLKTIKGLARDRDKRESERSELRLLVGKNIARLSQLDGVDLELYTKVIEFALTEGRF